MIPQQMAIIDIALCSINVTAFSSTNAFAEHFMFESSELVPTCRKI
ncbi:hypothetical protein [Vibrio alfacsensis]